VGRAYREISVLICSQVECVERSNIERATPAALRRLPLVRVPRVIEDSLERAAQWRCSAAVRITRTTIHVDADERGNRVNRRSRLLLARFGAMPIRFGHTADA